MRNRLMVLALVAFFIGILPVLATAETSVTVQTPAGSVEVNKEPPPRPVVVVPVQPPEKVVVEKQTQAPPPPPSGGCGCHLEPESK